MPHMQLGRYKLQTVIMTNLAPFCQLYNCMVTFLLNNNTANRCTCVYLGLVYQRSDNGIQQISHYPGGMC